MPTSEIKGTLSQEYNGQYVYMYKLCADSIMEKDSALVTDGRFRFSTIEYLEDASVITVGNYPLKVTSCRLFIERGELMVSLKNSLIVSGSPMNDKLYDYIHCITSFHSNKEKTDRDSQLLTQKIVSIIDENITNALGRQIAEWDIQNDYGMSVLQDTTLFSSIYRKGDSKFKNIPVLKSYYLSIEEAARRVEFRKDLIGKFIEDIQLYSIDGGKKQLYDCLTDADLYYIDVWASWCSPCIADIEKLKKIKKNIPDSMLTVVSVSVDQYMSNWEKRVNQLDMSWGQLSELVPQDSSAFFKRYEIVGIPFGILLDKQKRILQVGITVDSLQSMLKNEGIIE